MKIALGVLFLMFACSAFGQTAGYLSAQAQPTHFIESPQHASPHDLAPEQSLIGAGVNPYQYAQGEQPVWQFGEIKPTRPLGDIARELRKEHLALGKRAEVTWEN